MSQFIGAALPVQVLAVNVDTIQANFVRPVEIIEYNVLTVFDNSYMTPWWGRPVGLMADCMGSEMCMLAGNAYEQPELNTGTTSSWGITGVTRDVYGAPLGSVTVKLFLTSNDSKLDQVISDVNGLYLVSTPYYYPTTHYIVSYKTGTPDVTGATVNTLTGS